MVDSKPDQPAATSDQEGPFYYPNRMGRILLLAYEDVLGHNGLHALLNLAGYPQYAQITPPNNSDKQFSFEVVGGLTQALIDMYGPRGMRGVAWRVGRVVSMHGLREYGQMMGVAELTFQLLPLSIKFGKGAQALSDLFNNYTDQRVRLQETPETLYWHVERNPVSWGVKADRPVCHLTVGVLQESLLWLSGGKDFHIEESACIACGDDVCSIAIDKKPLD